MIEVATYKTARDSGEFETRVDAIAWLAGSMLAYDGADRFTVALEPIPGHEDANASGSFMWRSAGGWRVTIVAEWPAEREPQPDPGPVDLFAVRDALDAVATGDDQ